ncbi:MAG: hypothetical protein ACYTDW_22090 [Planctomycetota bacterium]|jgi:ABC-type uncharacterized transport system permease subunit
MIEQSNEQGKLERITRRWWFFGLFVLMQFTIPPYASKGYKIEDWGNVIFHALSNAIVHQYSEWYHIFKVIPIILLVCIIVFRNKVARLFAIYVGISYMLFAIGQNIAITEQYGVTTEERLYFQKAAHLAILGRAIGSFGFLGTGQQRQA